MRDPNVLDTAATDTALRLDKARRAIDLEWTPERAARIASAVNVRKRRRTLVKTVAVTLALVAPLLWKLDAPSLSHRVPVVADNVLTLDEGSVITPLDATTKLAVYAQKVDEVELSLRRGGAHFDIVHNEARRFTVHIDTVKVHVLGTQFRVERLDDAVVVAVEHGTVKVEGPRGTSLVVDGEAVRVPLHDAMAKAPIATLKAPPRAGVDVISRLFADADQARAAQDYPRAAHALERIVTAHPSDDRAPMAAFILGRLRSEKLNDACAAQAAFAQARSLSPQGPLVSDAATREHEAQALCLR